MRQQDVQARSATEAIRPKAANRRGLEHGADRPNRGRSQSMVDVTRSALVARATTEYMMCADRNNTPAIRRRVR